MNNFNILFNILIILFNITGILYCISLYLSDRPISVLEVMIGLAAAFVGVYTLGFFV